MQADVLNLFFINMNLGFARKFHFLMHIGHAIFDWGDFGPAGNYVVPGAGRHALRKLTAMVGNEVPTGMLFPLRVDGNPDPVDRPIVRRISGPRDQSIVFARV